MHTPPVCAHLRHFFPSVDISPSAQALQAPLLSGAKFSQISLDISVFLQACELASYLHSLSHKPLSSSIYPVAQVSPSVHFPVLKSHLLFAQLQLMHEPPFGE